MNVNFPKLVYKLNVILVKIPTKNFVKYRKDYSKLVKEGQMNHSFFNFHFFNTNVLYTNFIVNSQCFRYTVK